MEFSPPVKSGPIFSAPSSSLARSASAHQLEGRADALVAKPFLHGLGVRGLGHEHRALRAAKRVEVGADEAGLSLRVLVVAEPVIDVEAAPPPVERVGLEALEDPDKFVVIQSPSSVRAGIG